MFSAKEAKTILNRCNRRHRRTFCDMVNVHDFNIASIFVHGKELLRQLAFHQKYKRSHNETNVRHICEIGVRTRWDLWSENHGLCKYLSLIGDEQVISLQRTKVYVFSDSVSCLAKIHENPQSYSAWEDRLGWFKSSPEYWIFDRIDGEPMEFEWNISQDLLHCSSATKFKIYCWDWGETPQNFTRRIIFMSMFNDITWGSKDNKKECESDAQLVSQSLVQRKKWYSISEESTRWMGQNGGEDDGDTRRKRTPSLSSHESIVQRSTQKQRRWKIVDPPLCRPRDDYSCFSNNYFCKSAQSLRSSRRNVWRIWILSR